MMKVIEKLKSTARSLAYVRFLLSSSYPSVRDENEFFTEVASSLPSLPESSTLDLGCGMTPRNPFRATIVKGIDLANPRLNADVVTANLFVAPIPFGDGTFHFITAHDFIEHVPRTLLQGGELRNPFIELMNEVYRVLTPGGFFYSKTPAYPHKQAFQDPTHVNIISEDTFPYYLCLNKINTHPWATAYGFRGCFSLINQAWHNAKLLTLMQKTDLPKVEFMGL